ncbi:cell division protein ZipA C-terminal FtsZ-binding domain-containing protein [Thiosulfativibrio zosterae]|uniref:Cell division protein ZipA n=1 Tax=Thiosulfativibrio zosterae TaxID=2675053 RepID=A0A6F8PNJ2_9GAMM|nr:cell division protein ZipA C-terminal FtsZ-binding domain-containing protein [Thiosulfativibrio zosterae]BBP43691.1 hypothetical protein THMIRHAT_14370 [Thiosulfativibrio zosterae]
MNELQLVLLIFALVVVAVMVFLHYRNQPTPASKGRASKSVRPESDNADSVEHRQKASHALNEFGEGHIPVSNKTQARFHAQSDEDVETVPENQGKLPFGDEFDDHEPAYKPRIQAEKATKESAETQNRAPQHFVLEVEDLKTLDEVGPIGAAGDKQPSFGKPANTPVTESENKLAEVTEPQVFAVMVMGSQDFAMDALNKSLLGVGLSFAPQGIYVKKDTLGKPYLHVANIMEPGTFPAMEEERFSAFTTQGVVLILSLPTSVKAPAAMNDMIMIARKVSQRLNGRLYDAQRHLLKESDIQAMRDAAIAYETVGI